MSAIFIDQNATPKPIYVRWFCSICHCPREEDCDCSKIPPPLGQKLYRRMEYCKIFDDEKHYEDFLTKGE